MQNTYSVPSRLIGERLKIKVFDNRLEVLYGGALQLEIPRLLGRKKSHINYRHVIKSLVRKPGAFARYKYQSEMFPSLDFRRAYDALREHYNSAYKADMEYLLILQKAAFSGEEDIICCLKLLQSEGVLPDSETITALVQPCDIEVPKVEIEEPSLSEFDDLIEHAESLKEASDVN